MWIKKSTWLFYTGRNEPAGRSSIYKGSVNVLHGILRILQYRIKCDSCLVVFFITFDIGKNRISGFCTFESIEINFSILILAVLVQRKKGDIFLDSYRENSKDGAFNFCIILHGQCDGTVLVIYLASSPIASASAAAGSTVARVAAAVCKWITHFIFLILSGFQFLPLRKSRGL